MVFSATEDRKEELGVKGLPTGSVVTRIFDKETEAELGDTAKEEQCLHMPQVQSPGLKLLGDP